MLTQISPVKGGIVSKSIPLTQGKFAIVDDEDYAFLMQWKWFARKDSRNWYAARNIGRRPHRRTLGMHRAIMNPPDEMEVDHRDGNGLNNRRSNLRICSHQNNSRNMRPQWNSIFRGVSQDKRRKTWRARIRVDNKEISIGTYSNPHDAARAYNTKAVECYGEHARLNDV